MLIATHEFETWEIMLIVVDSHKMHWTSATLNTNCDGKIYCVYLATLLIYFCNLSADYLCFAMYIVMSSINVTIGLCPPFQSLFLLLFFFSSFLVLFTWSLDDWYKGMLKSLKTFKISHCICIHFCLVHFEVVLLDA